MAIITPPAELALQIGSWQLGQQRYDITEQSDGNGHTATRLGAPPRWRLRLGSVPALLPADAARWKAAALALRGRINRLAMWDVTNPVPRGTAKGVITLAASAAAGAASVQLAGCRGLNALLGGSFETDSNADGLADGWSRYFSGSTGTLGQYLSPLATVAGAWSQLVEASALGTSTSDNNGVSQTAPVAHLAGKNVAAACYVAIAAGSTAAMQVAWLNAADIQIGSMPVPTTSTAGSLQYLEAVGVCPADAVRAVIYIWQYSGSGSAAAMYIDGAQLVAAPIGALPPPPTLQQGDMLQLGSGVGSHYCMVTADATGTDAGAMTVSIEPPLRQAISSGAVVAWNKPVAHYKLTTDSQAWQGVPGSSDVGGFALDLLEDWRP